MNMPVKGDFSTNLLILTPKQPFWKGKTWFILLLRN